MKILFMSARFRKLLLLVLFAALSFAATVRAACPDGASGTADPQALLARGVCLVPQPQRITLHEADYTGEPGALSAGLVSAPGAENEATLRLLNEDMERIFKIEKPVRGAPVTAAKPAAPAIRLQIAQTPAELDKIAGFAVGCEIGDQGYVLDVLPDRIVAAAHTPVGLYYAAQTLTQLMDGSGAKPRIPGVRIIDWPNLKNRMVQYDLERGNMVNMEYLKRWVRELSRMKINQLMFFTEDTWKSPKYPFLGREGGFTPATAREIAQYAAQYHIEVVPQVESLGHGRNLLRHEELKDLRSQADIDIINPCSTRTLTVLSDLHGEMLDAFNTASMMHVGADEVWDFGRDLICKPVSEAKGDDWIYANHLNRLREPIVKRGKKMAFWGDAVYKHPKAAELMDKEGVIAFYWEYGDQKEYPIVKFYREKGFKEVYVCPALDGYFDLYPTLGRSFGNIRNLTAEGIRQKVEGMCCCTWGMQHGLNAELYLYGMLYAAECGWSLPESGRAFYDQRYAAQWLGIQPDARTAADIDAAYWFAWQAESEPPFWQERFKTGEMLLGPFFKTTDRTTDLRMVLGTISSKQKEKLRGQCERLNKLCNGADAALGRLRAAATRNQQTLDAVANAIRAHRAVAEKYLTMMDLGDQYRKAYMQQPRDAQQLAAILDAAGERLGKLNKEYTLIERGFARARDEWGADPQDVVKAARAQRAVQDYLTTLSQGSASAKSGARAPDPTDLGLGYPLELVVDDWQTKDILPSSYTQPKEFICEVSEWVRKPGRWEVEWDFTGGDDAIFIVETGLYECSSGDFIRENFQPLAVDKHQGEAGAAEINNIYRFDVKQINPARRHFIVGKVYDPRSIGSNGNVWLRRRDWD